jgi:hypothetical protein
MQEDSTPPKTASTLLGPVDLGGSGGSRDLRCRDGSCCCCCRCCSVQPQAEQVLVGCCGPTGSTPPSGCCCCCCCWSFSSAVLQAPCIADGWSPCVTSDLQPVCCCCSGLLLLLALPSAPVLLAAEHAVSELPSSPSTEPWPTSSASAVSSRLLKVAGVGLAR